MKNYLKVDTIDAIMLTIYYWCNYDDNFYRFECIMWLVNVLCDVI